MLHPTPFIYCLCQPGAETALKAELAASHPALKLAYSQAGFVTFKHGAGPLSLDFRLTSAWGAPTGSAPAAGAVFARRWGLSWGRFDSDAAVLDLAAALSPAPCLHVFERPVGEERPAEGAPICAEVEAALRAQAPEGSWARGKDPAAGQVVVDVCVGEGGWRWLGAHVHHPADSRWPGGCPQVPVPERSPSRAYAKLQEMALRFDLPLRPGEVAIEVGSAPGGATLALLERGVGVVGIDPEPMDPGVMAWVGPAGAKASHLPLPIARVKRAQLPRVAHWLVLDMNLAPLVALQAVAPLAAWYRRSLKGVVFTLKLFNWGMAAQLPELLRRVSAMGLTQVRAAQLPTHRQEVGVVGLNLPPA